MPKIRGERVEPTEDWNQLQLLGQFPAQRAYELLRPIVLFGCRRPHRSPPPYLTHLEARG